MSLGTFLAPRLLMARLRQRRYEKSHLDEPWLSPASILLLESWLRPTDHGIEWGSGRSTLWFAARVAHLTSVENAPEWHAQVLEKIRGRGFAAKVDYRLVACPQDDNSEPEAHPYVAVAGELASESLDFALVDGNFRYRCIRAVMDKIKPGGLLILDNANRFVPNRIAAGHATVHEPRDVPFSETWGQLIQDLTPWRAMLTTDGIWDTRLWVKPAKP